MVYYCNNIFGVVNYLLQGQRDLRRVLEDMDHFQTLKKGSGFKRLER